MTKQRYHIVEYRMPYEIHEALSVDDAVFKANKIFEQEFGFIPSAWFARVFVYENDEEIVGPTEEWFYNPQGVKARKIDANYVEHEERAKNE
jgi:hypothetical protein